MVSEEESREYYRKAVFLEPGRQEVYLRYLSDVQTDGVFSEEEERFLRDTLHTVRPGSDQTYEELLAAQPEAYLETAFQIGLAYWYSCPRDDSRRIALGWFEKAVAQEEMAQEEMAQESSAQAERAALYLEMGESLEKIHSSDGGDALRHAARYWEDLGRILEKSRDGQGLEDSLMQLKFCRESLYTLTFLSGDLTRSGIGSREQLARIGELETLAIQTPTADKQSEIHSRILEEIQSAAKSAGEAVRNSSRSNNRNRG